MGSGRKNGYTIRRFRLNTYVKFLKILFFMKTFHDICIISIVLICIMRHDLHRNMQLSVFQYAPF